MFSGLKTRGHERGEGTVFRGLQNSLVLSSHLFSFFACLLVFFLFIYSFY